MKLSFIGVDFFFVISGFLISYQLFELRNSIEHNKVSFFKAVRNFIVRRGSRIFPLYYLILILATLFNHGEIRDAFIYNLTYTSNFYFIKVQHWGSIFSHFWSLSVEEHFYFVWPFIVLLARRNFVLPIILTIALLSIFFRYFSFTNTYDYLTVHIHTISCLDLFMVGTGLAYFLFHFKNRFIAFFSKKIVKVTILLGLAISYSALFLIEDSPIFTWVFFRTIFGIFCTGFIGLLVIGFKGLAGNIFEHKWLITGGKLSYSIYLLHNFVPGILLEIKKLELPTIIEFIIYFVCTVLLSMLLHRIIEKPARKFGQKFKIRYV